MHDVLASLLEGVKAHKKCICSDFPLVSSLSFALILKVSFLELGAGLKCERELIMSFFGILTLNGLEDGLAVNVLAALVDHSIADLTD
jgi:hypothetical protein